MKTNAILQDIEFELILIFFQGQFNYGSEDLWVNGGAGFPSTTPQQQQQQQPEGQNNNNAYFVQVDQEVNLYQDFLHLFIETRNILN